MVLILIAGVLGVVLRRSLPVLDGQQAVAGLRAAVRVDRDALGVPTLTARDRLDASFALGFVHAQDRFFQMDLLRRSAAGELAALLGRPLLGLDREVRVHRFRERARRIVQAVPQAEHFVAYAGGVNAGLAGLGARPCEYVLLRARPEPWLPEDAVLCVFAMYLDLQSSDGDFESAVGVLHDVLPPELAAFLATPGTSWDTPLLGGAFLVPPIPGEASVDLRQPAQVGALEPAPRADIEAVEVPGSNQWAVAGARTADGRALLAGDMHLGIRVPNIWYRARLVYNSAGAERSVTGVTLPGTPAVVAGSNGDVAWTFTNSQVDVSDLVLLEPGDAAGATYKTEDGARAYAHQREILRVRGGASDTLDVLETLWGPVLDVDHAGRSRAYRWIAHDPAAVNLGLLDMETVQDVDTALEIANRTGIPTQNCLVADRSGRIGWTLMGPLPQRFGFDGRLPSSWAKGERGWNGVRAPAAYPRLVDPAAGILWTANNRVVDGAMLDMLGDGGYALGARARQIRARLEAQKKATALDMLQLQLDDRALFLAPWRELLLAVLAQESGQPHRAELAGFVQSWGGRASIESVGYRVVRDFRRAVAAEVFAALLRPCRAAEPRLHEGSLRQREGPLWRLVQERPPHLLDPRSASWEAHFAAAVDTTLARLLRAGPNLAERTWGEANTTRIRHPLSRAVPQLGRWLDMRSRPLPGDVDMPRVQGPASGASQRLVVSPGREEVGFFHMPGGQSGHPLSRFYRNSHAAWEEGQATPFLPGATVHTLVFVPGSSKH